MLKTALGDRLMDFLREDVGLGDITSEAVVPIGTKVRAQIIVKQHAVVAGISEAETFFELLGVRSAAVVKDGDEVLPGTIVAEVDGDGRAVLTAERTVLNILMRMSGIATATRKLTERLREAGLSVRVAATRKTAPGLRYFDKRAVSIGGGDPHRFRLDDAFLVKDNHIKIAGSIEEAVKRVRSAASFSKKIEVEARTRDEAVEIAKLGVDVVMLDNMTLEEAEKTMETLSQLKLRDKVLIEISGGVTEENLLEYAKLKPDIISLGSLTHSTKAVDISLEVVEARTEEQEVT